MTDATDTLLNITKRCLKAYGQEVVEERAVPDYRDGLKPVHRFILWSCYRLGLVHGTPFKKSARTVGDVLGKYHPHGDQSCYQAMVGLAGTKSDDTKTWVTKNSCVPLIEGYGNWGDNLDNAASMRYCFTGDTRVMTEDGLLRLDSLVDQKYLRKSGATTSFTKHVASLDQALKASHWVNSGKRTVYELTTSRGFKVRATSNEPFLTLNSLDYSWTELKDLKVGDFVSMKRGSDVLPSGKAQLPKFIDNLIAHNSIRYKAFEFPTHMSEELAFILGVLVAEGHARFGVGFNNTNRPYYEKFVNCWKKVFPSIEFSECICEPRSFGKKKFKSFSVKGTSLKKYFELLGVQWGSYNQVIPEIIFRSSKSEMSAFLSGLFEGDGSVAGSFVDYHSKSAALYQDIQNVLLNYYGCIATIGKSKLYVSGKDNVEILLSNITFESKVKKRDACRLLSKTGIGSTSSDVMPTKFLSYLEKFSKSVRTTKRRFIAESGDYISYLGSGNTLGVLERFPKPTRRANAKIKHCAKSFGRYFPEAASKLNVVANRNYFYDRIVEIKKIGKEWTYDLTVPATHAFVANGFIAHNTEARLSEFSTKYLLDPVYLAVTDMVPNFSGDDQVPLVLPAKLPVVLLNGSVSIAFGVSAECPAFEPKGVISLVSKCLQGVSITPKLLATELVFTSAFGGVCISDVKEVYEFHKTGTGSLKFSPEVEMDEKKRLITLRSSCPGLSSKTSWATLAERLSQLKEVNSVADASDRHGFKFEIVSERGVEFNTFLDIIEAAVIKKYSYSIGITKRETTGVTFARTHVGTIIKDWCAWRVALETKVIKHLISVESSKLSRVILLILAVNNLKVIMASLSKEDSAGYISQHLKITVAEANIILDLKVRQLKALEKTKLLSQKKSIELELKTLHTDLKQPTNRVLKDLISIQL